MRTRFGEEQGGRHVAAAVGRCSVAVWAGAARILLGRGVKHSSSTHTICTLRHVLNGDLGLDAVGVLGLEARRSAGRQAGRQEGFLQGATRSSTQSPKLHLS